jgi:hypothetical protein
MEERPERRASLRERISSMAPLAYTLHTASPVDAGAKREMPGSHPGPNNNARKDVFLYVFSNPGTMYTEFNIPPVLDKE